MDGYQCAACDATRGLTLIACGTRSAYICSNICLATLNQRNQKIGNPINDARASIASLDRAHEATMRELRTERTALEKQIADIDERIQAHKATHEKTRALYTQKLDRLEMGALPTGLPAVVHETKPSRFYSPFNQYVFSTLYKNYSPAQVITAAQADHAKLGNRRNLGLKQIYEEREPYKDINFDEYAADYKRVFESGAPSSPVDWILWFKSFNRLNDALEREENNPAYADVMPLTPPTAAARALPTRPTK